MADDQPPASSLVQPLNNKPSFGQILGGLKPNPRTLSKAFTASFEPKASIIQSEPTQYKREPTFLLTQVEDDKLAAPFQLALVGKLKMGRPTMDYLWKEFQTIGFKGGFSLGMIDRRLVLIYFHLEEDFQRCWMKGVWTFDKHSMRIQKWTPTFNPTHESPIVPVWVSFEGLPIHRFNKKYLHKVATIIDKPLKSTFLLSTCPIPLLLGFVWREISPTGPGYHERKENTVVEAIPLAMDESPVAIGEQESLVDELDNLQRMAPPAAIQEVPTISQNPPNPQLKPIPSAIAQDAQSQSSCQLESQNSKADFSQS
ncbi:OLC1v1003099C1 [Oldenlandia corymbosa var. corymbosa]|uniref:OLC1v1003099C1 n=1 Tax=Oldenlandia corymbosa var. corymbosa TaxID=529605 RepID=A0AAV1DAI7_OLDCO|nr:OLC1v1003099C1 [Oldenlandia corymbosa var. corymbosa]